MAETKVGGVHVSASIGTAEYVADAKKIKTETVALERSLKSSFSGMTAAVKGFGGALTAGLSIGLLAGVAKKALDFAAAIGTTAKQLGVGTKELQLFRHAADQMGVKNAEADKGLERLGVTLGKAAAGSTSATKALAAVGVTLEDIKTKSRTEIFGQIADQMIRQGGAAKNAAAANAIFGESASKLTPLLDKGSKGINELSAAAERLGIVLSDRQIQQADETAQKLDDVRAVLSAQIAGVVADNAASIVSLANALAKLASAVTTFLGSNPQAALGILGALAGSRFGLPGAAAGGIAGLFAGGRVAGGARDASTDIALRKKELARSRAELARVSGLYGGTGVNKDQIAKARKEVQRQTELAFKAAAAATARTTSAGTAAIPQFLAPSPKKGGGRKRTPRAARGPRDRSDDVSFQFDQEMRRAEMDTLRAQQSLARTSADRYRIALEILDLEKEIQNAELDNRVRIAERDFAEGKITEATLQRVKVQAEQLRLEYEKQDSLERQALAEAQAERAAEDAARLQALSLDLDRDLLESRAQLAETAAERRRVELELLDFAYRQRKAALDAAIAQEKDAEALKRLTLERDRLMETYNNNRQGVINSTRGPMESWKAEFGDITEEMEDLKVRGIMSAVDALGELTNGFDAFRDAALSAIKQVLAEMIRLQLMKIAVGLFGGSSTGVVSGGGTLGPLPGIPGAARGGTFALPAFAAGGAMILGGRGGVDRNLLMMNGIPIARVSRGEAMSITPANEVGDMRGGMTINAPISINAPMTSRQARETGNQIGAALKAQMARASKVGIAS